jgi:DNA-binding response OmpR family regulator
MERIISANFVLNPAECTILVVDDSENVVELVVAMLSAQKYRVDSASDAAEGMKYLQSQRPDLIITDLMMPDTDGFEFVRRVRQLLGQTFIPVVMFTASNNEADRVKALNNGADDFITKPINRHELIARVRNLLRLKKTLDFLNTSMQEKDKLLQEVTTRYLELEAAQPQSGGLETAASGATSDTVLAAVRAIHSQLQQPLQGIQAYLDLAAQKTPGRELELALGELSRLSQTIQVLEEVIKSGKI